MWDDAKPVDSWMMRMQMAAESEYADLRPPVIASLWVRYAESDMLDDLRAKGEHALKWKLCEGRGDSAKEAARALDECVRDVALANLAAAGQFETGSIARPYAEQEDWRPRVETVGKLTLKGWVR